MKNSNKGASRREVLVAGAAAGLLVSPLGKLAQAAELLAPTPEQTSGPFYPLSIPLDHDSDLVRVAGKLAEAFGKVTHIYGTVVNPEGKPIEGATVEFWQCDNSGKYNHPRDPQPQQFDDKFQGYGRTTTTADGAYRFRTIKPVPYDAPGVGTRAPHIHFKVAAEGYEELTSQLYIAGEQQNLQDFIFMQETPADRLRLLVNLVEAPEVEDDAVKGSFQIVLKPL